MLIGDTSKIELEYRGKPEYPEKNLSEPTTNSTHI